MNARELLSLVLAYTVVGGVLVTALCLGLVAAVVEVTGSGGLLTPARVSGSETLAALGNVALYLTITGICGGLYAFATHDSGLDTAAAGLMGGFDVTNPSEYRLDHLHVPGRAEFGFLLLGVAGVSFVSLVGVVVLT